MKKLSIQYSNQKIRQKRLSKLTYQLFEVANKEKNFVLLIAILIFFCGSIMPYPNISRWFGFALGSYSAIANDSIQTLGTFIASNKRSAWWHLWLFIGLIFIITITYSWIVYDGDVSFQRLAIKGFANTPQSFSFLQLFAPIILIVLTRMRMPVSTTFLLLNIFSSSSEAMLHIISKSLLGYIIAFVIALSIWWGTTQTINKWFNAKPWKGWIIIQWLTSGLLWSAWLMQDAANIAVFLPRQLNLIELLVFLGFIFFGMGLLFYSKGNKLQKIVNEKSGITDVRAATLVDGVYILILFYFKTINNIPMSTTWIFIGLLGGRELGISLTKKKKKKKKKKTIKKSLKLIKKDISYAFIGLILSIVLAITANPIIQKELKITILYYWEFVKQYLHCIC